MTTGEDALRSFLRKLRELRADIASSCSDFRSPVELFRLAVNGVVPRRGVLFGDCDYSVHGYGCSFAYQSGEIVDVDFSQDGAEIFDAWRVWLYASSIPEVSGVSREQVSDACFVLVDSGELLEHGSGWFRVRM